MLSLLPIPTIDPLHLAAMQPVSLADYLTFLFTRSTFSYFNHDPLAYFRLTISPILAAYYVKQTIFQPFISHF